MIRQEFSLLNGYRSADNGPYAGSSGCRWTLGMSSDNAKARAAATPPLEWQGELDAHLAELDSRLTHPRRRSTDADRQPELGHIEMTSELLDEIAWRVAEQIRRNGVAEAAPPPIPVAPGKPVESEIAEAGLRPGTVLLIRYRLPQLPWPFSVLQRRGRKKQHPLTTARVRG
jgi:hypothetical protein